MDRIEAKKGDIKLWLDGVTARVICAWYNDGGSSIPINEMPSDMKEFFRIAEDVLMNGDVWCTSCSDIINRDDIAGSHFAAVFCAKCWEEYKEKHRGLCSMCGSPRYSCCC